MKFRKGNKQGAKKFIEMPLDSDPICFKGYKGQKAALKSVDRWQEKIRGFVNQLIEDSKTE